MREALSRTQPHSAAIKCHQVEKLARADLGGVGAEESATVIRRNQTQSDAIRRNRTSVA
jgi:hypothetical protein